MVIKHLNEFKKMMDNEKLCFAIIANDNYTEIGGNKVMNITR